MDNILLMRKKESMCLKEILDGKLKMLIHNSINKIPYLRLISNHLEIYLKIKGNNINNDLHKDKANFLRYGLKRWNWLRRSNMKMHLN